MFSGRCEFQVALVSCALAIVIFYVLKQNSHENSAGVLQSLRSSLSKLSNFRSLLCCDVKCGIGQGYDGPVKGESDCQQQTFCVLWKSPPSKDDISKVVQAVTPDFKLIGSSKGKPQEDVAHFFIDGGGDQPLHFVNLFLLDDGSWWFDALLSEEATTLESAAGDEFYLGKYEGWLKNVSVRRGQPLDVSSDPAALTSALLSSRFVPCDTAAAHQFHLVEGRDVSAAAERFRHRAWRLLAAAAAALDELAVPFWLSSGTCLGYYRQCDFVPYMGDVDIGVRMASLRDHGADGSLPSINQLIQAMAARRLRLVHRFGRASDSLELCFRSPDDIKLDIFFFYDDGDVVWNGGTQARTGRKFRYNFPAFSLCWTLFRELRVRVPCDTETYLRANYGGEWRRPRADWDWKSSPPNVRENGAWRQEEMAEVVQLLET